MANYVLGLDLGPNSIGWATLAAQIDDEQERWTHEVTGFLDTSHANHPPMGVRVFEAGLSNFDSTKEESLCQKRRMARSARRNHQRRNIRRREVRRILRDKGFLPAPGKELQALLATDAYAIRARGLDEPLSAFELGRAFLHLAQRRGFKSNRKSGQSKEDRGMLKEIGELAKAMEETGARTLGEYFHRLRQQNPGQRVRAIHTRRNMYEEEFEALVEAQSPHHPNLNPEVVKQIRHFIFFQHPFELTPERRRRAPSRANLHRAPSVKRCPLEPKERCCAKGLWIAQEFRILKEINNLRLCENHGLERNLSKEERAVVLQLLRENERVKFEKMRKELHKVCGTDPEATFNLERGERAYLLGNSVEDRLRKSFKKKSAAKEWGELEEDTRQVLRQKLVEEEDESTLYRLLSEAGLSEEGIQKLLSWAPQDGFLGFSEKALYLLVPHLLAGKSEYHAIEAAYPQRPEFKQLEKLPPLDSKDLPLNLRYITNPVVRRALGEVRKVVNAIVREHGLPSRIIVEMARNMKEGADGRKKQSKKMRERQIEREKARQEIQPLVGPNPSRSDVDRYLIWKEQGEICLYTGRPIPLSELFQGEWDLDHILPHWQSLDDSFANKALVHHKANAEKGNRTPVQWLGKDSQEFRKLIQRAQSSSISWGKLKRLRQEAVDADDFAQRQLNDTRYITKAVVQYLELLYRKELRAGEKAVQSTRGSLTAELRRHWGLNNILPPLTLFDGSPMVDENGESGGSKKSRADHRHHAVDALVVALSSRSYLKKYQDFWKRKAGGDFSMAQGTFPEPWSNFRAEAGSVLARIQVSHRVMRKIAGALHEETFRGQAKDGRGAPIPQKFTTRVPLSEIKTKKHLEEIRSLEIQKILRQHLLSLGWDGESKNLPKDWHLNGVRHYNGNPILKVRKLVTMNNPVCLGDQSHRFAVVGNNHHVEIFRDSKNALCASVVPTYEAARRVRKKELKANCCGYVLTSRKDGLKFIFSLARKEAVFIGPTQNRRLAIVQKLSGELNPGTKMDIYFRDARDARPATEGNKRPLKRISSFRPWEDLNPIKVQVDPLGRIFPAND